RFVPSAGVELRTPAIARVEDVDAISGALILMSRDAFERVGGFDEGYFLHCEDLDLCRRVRDAGYRVVCASEIRVLHAKGGSSRQRPVFVAWHKHRGMWRWFNKFDPAARNPLLRVFVWSGIWFAFVARLPLLAGRRAIRTFAR
ncbi:MAG: glycosyltransferase family 2 protein, partial [Rudaea sp.]